MLAHVSNAVVTTLEQIGGTLGVGGLGTLYLSSAGTAEGVADATRGLGIVAAAFAAVALLATLAAQLATRRRTA